MTKGWAWATHPPSPTEFEPVTPHLSPTDPRAEVIASGSPLANSELSCCNPLDKHSPHHVPKLVPNHILVLEVEAGGGKIQVSLSEDLQGGPGRGGRRREVEEMTQKQLNLEEQQKNLADAAQKYIFFNEAVPRE